MSTALSSEKFNAVEAEALRTAAGNMCRTVLRGTVPLPVSETSSSRQGSHRNLRDLLSPAAALAVPGRIGKLERATPIRNTGEVGRLHSNVEALNNASRQVRGGRRPVEGRRPTHPSHTAPEPACPQRPEPTDRNWMGRSSPERWWRWSFDRSLVRDTNGAAKQKPHAGICAGNASNGVPYHDRRQTLPASDARRRPTRLMAGPRGSTGKHAAVGVS
jgi:hypothetical protein